jgi:2-polyprenyl-6-methoxyphenol hydroxylase-like FAD-dependent oxidoreductase
LRFDSDSGTVESSQNVRSALEETMTTSSALPPAQTDVLVVGAGPAGLALTASLALQGVDHVTIEPRAEVSPGSKAAGIQPRTLEYLQRLGVADKLVAAGMRGHGFALHDADRPLLRLGYDRLDTPYPFLCLLGQQATEEVLQRRALEVGGRLHRGWRLLDYQPDHPGVLATVASADGTVRAVRARYLVGADGVHSTVRRLAGIGFEGTSPEQLYGLADVRLDPAPAGTDTTFFVGGHGLLLVSPLPGGLHRVVASVPANSAAPTARQAEALLAQRGGGELRHASVAEVVAASTYHVQQRVAARMVDGPVVLAGDAAHTHSPAGGQGLNTGVQDAANLAWRLTEILRGGADPALLAGYHAERHPVAEHLIAFTGRLTALATLRNPTLAGLRNTVLTSVDGLPEVTGWLARQLSQLDIGYQAADAPADAPVPGARLAPGLLSAQPDRPAWVLADPGATASRREGRLFVTPAPRLSGPVLVRPDGYLAGGADASGDLADTLDRLRTAGATR